MKTEPIDHDESTYYRRVSYAHKLAGNHDAAKRCSKHADALEAKEPLAWQPAGFTPISQLLNPKNTK